MDPYTWIYLIIAIAVSVALAPKPPKLKPASLDDFDIPTAEEGRPVPVVFGTVRITGANILWYGDLRTEKIKKSSIMGSTTIGYKYHVGFHFGLCHGPVDAFTKFEAGDKTAWSGNITPASVGAAAIAQVRAADLFGGKKKEGGLWGDLYTHFGGPTETVDAYLASEIGGTVPAFRGIFSLVFKHPTASSGGAYIGTTPYPKPFAFTVKRVTKGWLNDTVWYSAKAAIGTGMNPAHIIYETLTNTEWGMGLPADKIDNASFTAAADLLYTEGFGLSLLWNQQASVEDFLSEVINHIAGVLAFDRTTGTYRLKVIRGDYTAASLPVYGPETISRVTSYQRQGWGETVNELTLGFTDPTTLKDTSVTVHDLANVRAQGVRVATKVDFGGIADATLAQKVAIRELAARSTPLGKLTFTVNRDLWATKKADVLKVTWPALGISEMVVRVLRVRQGTLTNGELEIEAVEDIFALALSTYTTQPAPGSDATDPTVDVDDDTAGPSVVSSTLTAPPGSPVDGANYLIPTGATGAWAGHAGEVATWDADAGAWIFSTVAPGTVVTDTSTGTQVQTVTGGTAVPYTPIQTSGKVIFGTSISPAALGADVNDYAPTGLLTSSGVRLSASGAARTITGLAAGAGGQLLLVHNVGALDLTLKDESASSTAANRFALNSDVVLKADQSTLLQYDATSSRWRVIGGTGSGGSSPTTTKGDLIVRSATADSRLPVGANGLVLMADSAEALGVKWAAVRTTMQSEILADSPVFYAPLDEPTGTTPTDIVGGLTVTLLTGATMGGVGPPSNNNRALTSNGVGGAGYNFPKPAAFVPNNFSIEFGFYGSATLGAGSQFYSQMAVVMADIGGVANDYGVGFQGAMRPIFGTGNPDTSITPATGSFNDGNLHHCVCTRNGTTGAMEMFIDGVSVASGVGSTGTVGGTSTIWGGLNATNAAFRVFGIALYNSVLSPARVSAHYAAITTGNGSGYVSPTTTAGDLIVRGASSDGRLPVGTDGQVLTVDTTLGSKLKWATPAAGGGGGSSGDDVLTRFSGASIKCDTNKTFTAGTAWSWDSAEWDTDAYWSAAAPTKIVIPTGGAGKYLFVFAVDITSGVEIDPQLWQNGVRIHEEYAGGGFTRPGFARMVNAAVGDYFEIKTGIGSPTVEAPRTRFQVMRLSPVTIAVPAFSSGVTHVDAPPVYPDPMNDEFDSASLDAKWTWLQQGAATATNKDGALTMVADRTTAGTNLSCLIQPVTGTFKVRSRLALSALSASSGYYGVGMMARNSANGRIVGLQVQRTNSNTRRMIASRWNSPTSYNGDLAFVDNPGIVSSSVVIFDWLYFEIENDGTNLYLRYSHTGEEGSFLTHQTEPLASFIGAVTDVGVSVYAATGTAAPSTVGHFDWFRKITGGYAPGKFSTNAPFVTGVGRGLTHVDAPPVSPDPMDDEFEGSVLDSKWTWRNQGTTTVDVSSGAVTMLPPVSAGENLRIIEQTVSGSWKVRARVAGNNEQNYNHAGLCVVNSANGKVIGVCQGFENNQILRVIAWTNVTTATTVHYTGDAADAFGGQFQYIYLEIECDGTNLYFRASGDGKSFLLLHSQTVASFLGAADRVGLFCNVVNGSSTFKPSFDWFRKIGASYAPGKFIVNGASSLLAVQAGVPPSPDSGNVQLYAGPALENIVPLMTSNTAPSGTASADSSYFANGEYNAYDGTSNGWIAQNTAYPHWTQYQFPTAKLIKSYEITPWSIDSFPTRNPTDWILKGSNDGTNWTDLDTRTYPIGSWVQNTPVRFAIAIPQSFTHYRLHITANGGNPYVGIKRLALRADGTGAALFIKDSSGNVKQVTLTDPLN